MLLTDEYTNPTLERTMPTPEMLECIQDCQNCHSICLRTVMHCLERGGRHAEATHVGLLLDCAEICETSASFMLRGSPLHTRTCALCADICRQCADDCAQFDDDPQMKACEDACRVCAQSCRDMAG